MIYNNIEKTLISVGEPKSVFGKQKYLTPVYYDGGNLEFAEKNKYVVVNGVETTKYDKEQIVIKSKTLAKMIEDIVEAINSKINKKIVSPIQTDGSFRLTIGKDSKFADKKRARINASDIKNDTFHACIAIGVPTFFTDADKSTLQLVLSECVVVERKQSTFEIDFDKLTIAE
jgi:hypothetical protein